MHLEASDADLHQAIDFGPGVGDVLRMNRAEGNQPLWLGGAVVRNPVVNLRRKADDVRTDVIDQASAFDACVVEESQEGRRVGGGSFHICVIRSGERRVGKECRSRWSPYQ